MICPNCQAQNPPGSQQCLKCANPLSPPPQSVIPPIVPQPWYTKKFFIFSLVGLAIILTISTSIVALKSFPPAPDNPPPTPSLHLQHYRPPKIQLFLPSPLQILNTPSTKTKTPSPILSKLLWDMTPKSMIVSSALAESVGQPIFIKK